MQVLCARGRAPGALLRDLPFASVFFVKAAPEANGTRSRLRCRMTGRRTSPPIEGAFHGRTAAAGAVTWGAQAKGYGFPRTPFDVSFIPRGDTSAITSQITARTAAADRRAGCRGLPGRVDLGARFSRRCASGVMKWVRC